MARHATVRFQLTSGDDDQDFRLVTISSNLPIAVGRSSRDPSKSMFSEPTNLNVANSVISRNHARILYEMAHPSTHPGDYMLGSLYDKEFAVFLEDTGSSHGTFVNGTQVMPNSKREIQTGDEVRFGVSINRSDGSIHLPPTYEIEIDDDAAEQGYESSHRGKSYSMPNESEDEEIDDEDLISGQGDYYYDDDEEDGQHSLEYESDQEDLYAKVPFSPKQPDLESMQEDMPESSQAYDETAPPTSAQKILEAEKSFVVPSTPKIVRSLLTPEDEVVQGLGLPALQSRTNSAFWDSVLENPSASAEVPTSPRVGGIQIRDLLSAAPPQHIRKRKLEDFIEAEDMEMNDDTVDGDVSAIVAETLQYSFTGPDISSDGINDTTLIGEDTEAVAQLLKEPTEKLTHRIEESDVHRVKRSRLSNAAFGAGMFVAGSASAIAILAALPEGFFS